MACVSVRAHVARTQLHLGLRLRPSDMLDDKAEWFCGCKAQKRRIATCLVRGAYSRGCESGESVEVGSRACDTE
eukprot:1309748-Prymnesium_polylepis.2